MPLHTVGWLGLPHGARRSHGDNSDKSFVRLQVVCEDAAVSTTRPYGGVAGDERRADRRRRLLDAGYTLLAEGGPAALTVTGVCKASGLTTRYFYEHFPNRDALMVAIVEADADAVIALIVEAATSGGDTPQTRGEAAVGALLDALEADPRRVQMTREQDEAVLRLRHTVAARMTSALIATADLVWPGAAAHPERVALAASLTVGGVLQMVVDWVDGDAQLSREELVRIAARFAVATGDVVLSD
jgi:AcrR family transcriptional regulator